MSKIDEIRARYSDNGLSVDEYNKLAIHGIAQMWVDVKRTLRELDRVEAENAELVQKWNKLEAENAALKEQLAVEEKKAEKYAKNLSTTLHEGYELFAENQVLRAFAESYGFSVRLVHKEASEERSGQKPGPLENGGMMRNIDERDCKTGGFGTDGEQEGEEG